MVRLEGPAAGSDSVLSPDGRWRAFVIDRNDEPGGRVCLEAVHSGQRYELRGLPLPYRPLSALVWLDSGRLAFDRWSQPHTAFTTCWTSGAAVWCWRRRSRTSFFCGNKPRGETPGGRRHDRLPVLPLIPS